ncbi:G-type lectin S-receptor-like serine/threonine-protein kinase At1g67520 isoform X1 [Vigna unguiculata]|nr:G-type lectin S-receptor-like serine/threonine-protein kinase At1g67520 isoform X1 [Vigna unguiculata]
MRLILQKLLLPFMHLWLCWSSCVHVHAAHDSLKPGDTLNSSSPSLYSKSRKYFLRFYTIGIADGDFTYLTVQSAYENQIVWKGNREQPINDDAVLSLNFSGVLKIESESVKKPIILYSPPQPINNTVATLLDTGNFVLQHLHPNGRLSYNNKEGYVARADLCYGYNTEGGCQRWQDIPKCRSPGDVFTKKILFSNYENQTFEFNQNIIHSDCEAACWSDCNCNGFRELSDDGIGCDFYHWNSSKDIIVDGTTSGEDVYILETKGKIITPHHHGKKSWIWISTVIAATILLICASILFVAIKKRKHVLQEKKRKEMAMKLSEIDDFGNDFKKGHGLKVFDYTLVVEATNGFSSENKLGQGGFGPVYKGTLPTGEEVAIKRLSKSSTQGIVEFKNEVTLICELQHMNLVQLLGCCIHEEEKILIYEYMPNKSLDFYLFDCTRSKLLDWNKRFNIIQGISQGLLYLHKYSRLKVIHRDLKASNILLDENMNPKISDFGMARMFTQQDSVSNTNRVVGTYGYMSPEYAMEGVFSTKSDVYSFGVLMLEIVCGRKNTSFYDDDHPINLIGHVWELWKDDKCVESVDPSLMESLDSDDVQRCIHAGLLCVEHYANDRPTMSDVISMLTNKSERVSLPKRPAFYVQREMLNENLSSAGLCTASTVEITTSLEIELSQ